MSPPFSDYAATQAYLYSLRHHGAKYGIERMQLLCPALGHPERQFPVIHVAGTNGKGSTCAMLEAIYRAHGYRVGLFTSPHLVFLGERVQVNREMLSPAQIMALTAQIRDAAEALAARNPEDHPSFFEFVTAMAFLWFAQQQVDLAIIETGLGGRLDASNVVQPEVSAITSIGFDHMDILGSTLGAIAGEKAGIIKPGRPVVMGLVPPEADTVIRERAEALSSPIRSVREIFGEESLRTWPTTNLVGAYQQHNAATATLVTEELQARFPMDASRRQAALQHVRWAGRWERRALGDRELIFDATHNEEGARALDGNLAALRAETGQRPIIVAGTLGEARAAVLMPVVAEHAREIVLLRPHQPRACTFAQLRAALPDSFGGHVREANVNALFPAPGEIQLGEPGAVVVVTGSIYLLGEVMATLQHGPQTAEGFLQ